MEGKKNAKENVKKRMKKYHWLIVLCITTVTAMYVYGMTKIYLPDPLYIGFGQYLDLATGVIVISLILSGFVIGAIFKKKKKR